MEGARRPAARPGTLTPAQAFDPVDLLTFPAPHGVSWQVSGPDYPGTTIR